ncbi:unnamed protein product, partial [Phaeothamnion confervicola]
MATALDSLVQGEIMQVPFRSRTLSISFPVVPLFGDDSARSVAQCRVGRRCRCMCQVLNEARRLKTTAGAPSLRVNTERIRVKEGFVPCLSCVLHFLRLEPSCCAKPERASV